MDCYFVVLGYYFVVDVVGVEDGYLWWYYYGVGVVVE